MPLLTSEIVGGGRGGGGGGAGITSAGCGGCGGGDAIADWVLLAEGYALLGDKSELSACNVSEL